MGNCKVSAPLKRPEKHLDARETSVRRLVSQQCYYNRFYWGWSIQSILEFSFQKEIPFS